MPQMKEQDSSVTVSDQLLSSDSLQPHGLQQARLPCTSPTCGACSSSVQRVDDAVQPPHPPSSPSPPAFNVSRHQGLFQ